MTRGQTLATTAKFLFFVTFTKQLKAQNINIFFQTSYCKANDSRFYQASGTQFNVIKYAINSFASLKLLQKLESMNTEYFAVDYFEADADPSLYFLLGQEPPRKPSYCDLIPEVPSQDSANLVSIVTCESPKLKPCSLPVEENKETKVKKRKGNAKALPEGMQRGHWNLEENKRYHWFLQIYSTHFVNKHMRRMDKIFKTMERFVNTRQAEQCRSHHQKMEKKHGSFAKILKVLRQSHYVSVDPALILRDMKQNGVQCPEQLLTQAHLQSGVFETFQAEQVEKQEVKDANEANRDFATFLDPLLQFQCDGDQFLNGLIS